MEMFCNHEYEQWQEIWRYNERKNAADSITITYGTWTIFVTQNLIELTMCNGIRLHREKILLQN